MKMKQIKELFSIFPDDMDFMLMKCNPVTHGWSPLTDEIDPDNIHINGNTVELYPYLTSQRAGMFVMKVKGQRFADLVEALKKNGHTPASDAYKGYTIERIK